jgi:signal transduction histidine kinase
MTLRLALRERLALSFALALVLAYVAIAVCSVLLVDRSLTGSIDARLRTVAQAIVAIAGDRRDDIDREDREQFASVAADAGGALVLGPDGSIILGTIEDVPPWAPAALRAARIGRAFTVRNGGHELRALVERRRKHGFTSRIVVWQSMQIVHDVETPVVIGLALLGLVVSIGGYAIGSLIARRGLRPLTSITAIVADIAANDLDARVGPQPHADELGRLATTFDRMLDRLQSAFERQRRFTADASHDLRAPLATLRAEVDLALRRERTAPEYRSALAAVAEDADQLDRLIDSLLAAARSDGDELALRPLDLTLVARECVTEIAAFARAKNVTLQTDFATGGEIDGDPDLLHRAVLATLHNAVKYTPETGAVAVAVAQDAEHVTLYVRDEGPGFSELALQHALDRFWRDDTARGRSGSGLGLAIASEIVRRCHGVIKLGNRLQGGAEVSMEFPASARVPARS